MRRVEAQQKGENIPGRMTLPAWTWMTGDRANLHATEQMTSRADEKSDSGRHLPISAKLFSASSKDFKNKW